MHHYQFSPDNHLQVSDLNFILSHDVEFELSALAKEKINHGRAFLETKLRDENAIYYGINTGFGSLCNTIIDRKELPNLQRNLLLSHACGLGECVPQEIVRLMLILKIQSLCYGLSGVRLLLVEKLVEWLNKGIYPVVFNQGSLGASGDLAPLAHFALPLIGEGEVWFESNRIETQVVFQTLNVKPISLESKEGLALLNGTQFMTAYGFYCLFKAKQLFKWADFISAASLDGFNGRLEPFLAQLHQIRPHQGQIDTAIQINKFLEGSEIRKATKTQVQDPYSFRCIPQVHGASKDALNYVISVFETEANSVTDNPTLFPDDDLIVSGGNFHGQPLAITLDFFAIAMAEIGSISERRTYQLINGKNGLPDFLTPNPGIFSGLMIAQYAAASIVSQNKQLCSPASIDTIDTSKGQEDHVSMGANAATKALKVLENLNSILAIEWLAATQALTFRKPVQSSPKIEQAIKAFREKQSFIDRDVLMHNCIVASKDFINDYSLPVE